MCPTTGAQDEYMSGVQWQCSNSMLQRARLHLPYASSKTSTCQLYRCSSIMPGAIPIAVQSALNLAFCNLHLGLQCAYSCTCHHVWVLQGMCQGTSIFTEYHLYHMPPLSICLKKKERKRTYLIFVTDATDGVRVNFFGRCKFLQI